MEKKYSIIVIGAGITGLSTAMAWLKTYQAKQHPVLVLEKNATPGGCVTTFARKGFLFDTTQIIPDVSDLLDFFEIDIPLLKFDHYYARLFMADTQRQTARIFPIPSAREDFENLLINKYSEDEKAIRHFFEYCQQMHKELNYLKTEPKWYHIPRILFKCRKILGNSNKTYKQFLEKFEFKHPEVLQVLDTFSSFSGLSANRCAALLTACAMITTLKGSYRPHKGFIQFPMALRKRIEEMGGEFKMNAPVTRILVENNKAKGVVLESGETIFADYVISTADTKFTFETLLGEIYREQIKKPYFRKVRKTKMSPSGFAIHLGLDGKLDLESMGFNCGYNVLTSSPDAHARMFDAWENGHLLMSDDCFHLAVICPSLMTGGKQNLVIHVGPAPADKWVELRDTDYEAYKAEKQRVADFYIQKIETYMIPGLSSHIEFVDVSSPATYKRYMGSPTASQYDMMPVPSNFGKNRLPIRTPVKNMFIPKFSHGIWPCMQAGLQVVDMISGGKIMKGNSSFH